MGLFSGVEQAQATKGGVYVLPGSYLVEVVACHPIRNRKREDLVLVELKIVESTNAERKPGTSMSWLPKVQTDTFLPNIKAYFAAIFDSPESDVTEAVCEMAMDTVGPNGQVTKTGLAHGRRVRLNAQMVKTQKGGDFTKLNWSPYAASAAA